MQILDKAVMPDGTKIQLEDWHDENSKEYPDLYGYEIGVYPIAKNTGKYGFIESGQTFRLTLSCNNYKGYTDDMILTDYEALKNGTKTLVDLKDHFYQGPKDEFYLGLIDQEPEYDE